LVSDSLQANPGTSTQYYDLSTVLDSPGQPISSSSSLIDTTPDLSDADEINSPIITRIHNHTFSESQTSTEEDVMADYNDLQDVNYGIRWLI